MLWWQFELNPGHLPPKSPYGFPDFLFDCSKYQGLLPGSKFVNSCCGIHKGVHGEGLKIAFLRSHFDPASREILGFNPTVCTGVGCYHEPSLSIYANHPKHLTQLLLHRLTGSCVIECCNNISKVVRASVFRHTGSTASAPLTILKV